MALSAKFGLIIIVLVWVVQLTKGFFSKLADRRIIPEFFGKYLRLAWFSGLSGFFCISAYLSFEQYRTWLKNPLSKFFLPPYTNISYFFSYVFYHFWVNWVVALAFGLIVLKAADFFNRKFGERFLEKEEAGIFGLGVFLSGYPDFLIYIAVMITAGFLLSVFYSLFFKGRAPLFYLWLPAVILAIIIKSLFLPVGLLNVISF